MNTRRNDSTNICECKEKIRTYAESIGLHNANAMTLDMLIESHRTLREAAKRDQGKIEAIRAAAREKAYADAVTTALTQEYISRDRLKSMTVQELSNLFAE